jgi:hypothetical protein
MNKVQTIKCPHCQKVAALAGNPYRPFCSERCKTIDLGTWVSDEYRIPGEKAADPDEESE